MAIFVFILFAGNDATHCLSRILCNRKHCFHFRMKNKMWIFCSTCKYCISQSSSSPEWFASMKSNIHIFSFQNIHFLHMANWIHFIQLHLSNTDAFFYSPHLIISFRLKKGGGNKNGDKYAHKHINMTNFDCAYSKTTCAQTIIRIEFKAQLDWHFWIFAIIFFHRWIFLSFRYI